MPFGKKNFEKRKNFTFLVLIYANKNKTFIGLFITFYAIKLHCVSYIVYYHNHIFYEINVSYIDKIISIYDNNIRKIPRILWVALFYSFCCVSMNIYIIFMD